MKKIFYDKYKYNKNVKVKHGDQRFSSWLSEQQTNKFMNLYKRIQAELGGIEKAAQFVGLSHGTRTDLNQGSISYETAQKILNAFKNLKATQHSTNLQRN